MLNIDAIKASEDRAFLIDGDDPYWCDLALSFFINLISEENRSFNLNILDEPTDFSDILNAVETSSFLPGPHVVIVKNLTVTEPKSSKKAGAAPKSEGKSKKKTKTKEKNSDYIEAAIDAVFDKYLVFYNASGLPSNVKKKLTLIDAKKSDQFELRNIITAKFNGIGGIDQDAIATLITYTGGSMAKIDLEMRKLVSYCNGNKVTLDDIENLVSDTEENQIYDFTGAITSGNKQTAMKILDKFVAAGVSYIYLLAALTNQFRRMYYVKIADRTDDKLADIFSVKQYAICKARELAKNYNSAVLSKNLLALIDAESNIKSGIMTEKTAFDRVISTILSS
ncbi:MAG: DNA polymerase III subunit delta [Christensenellaceae bacterium]|nr:DNA polymerase III subunit delta [Christensenellaceae bacterium]